MADIFISYARADHSVAESLARKFEQQGCSVWWDTHLLSGQQFEEAIVAELLKARAVVVIWTSASVASEWVRMQAALPSPSTIYSRS